MAILGSRSSVWFLRSCRGRRTREKEFGRIWGQRGEKTAGGTRLGLGIRTKLGCRDDWRDVSRNSTCKVCLGVGPGKGWSLGGAQLWVEARTGSGGAHRGAGAARRAGPTCRWARPAGPRRGAFRVSPAEGAPAGRRAARGVPEAGSRPAPPRSPQPPP